MGIIEKAVGQHDNRKKDPSAPAQESKPAGRHEPAEQRQADSSATEHTVKIGHLAKIGPTADDENPGLSQEFRFLKRPLLSRVFNSQTDTPVTDHLVLVTSDLPGAGKSFVSLNLAASIAQEQLTNVVLIDGDPLRRNLSVALQQEDRAGLLEVLDDPALDPASLTLKTDIPSLRFLPAGQTRQNSTELLASRRLTESLSALVDPDTIVLIDSSPLLATTEASALADRVGHTVVVVEAGRTSMSDLSSVLKMLDGASSSVSLILNKVPRSASGRGRQDGHYYYGHQYGY